MRNAIPIYAVLDVSASTSPLIPVYNEAIADLVDNLASSPLLADVAYFCVITFSDDATVVMPLTKVDGITQIPQLQSGGATSYGSAFRVLRERIEVDVADLKAQGRAVNRPMVFFVTDGAPTDSQGHPTVSWRIDHDRLTRDFRLRPTIVTVGIGEVDVRILLQVASGPDLAFVSRPGDSPDIAVRGVFELLAQSFMSVLSSVRNATAIPASAVISAPEGLIQIPGSFR